MSFRLKIGLAFGGILFLTILAATTAMYGMNRVLSHQKELSGFTRNLENTFQTIIREQQAFIASGDVRHSMEVLSLIEQKNSQLNKLLARLEHRERKIQVEKVLSALEQYRKNFDQVVQNQVDMETMKSRLLRESQRLISNVAAIEIVGKSAVRILKIINETLVAEKNYILDGQAQTARMVVDNSRQIISIARQIQSAEHPGETRLYAFRIANIAAIYQDAFEKYMGFYKRQHRSLSAVKSSFDQLNHELSQYIDLVSEIEKTKALRLKQLVIVIVLFIVVVGVFAIVFLSKLITTPINQLKQSALGIQSGNLSTRVKISSKDEIGELGNIFNQMAERLEHSFDRLDKYRNHLEDLVGERTEKMQEEIRQHRLTQEALENEKDRALRYFDIAGSILMVLNTDQTIAMINKAGSQVLGGEKEQIIGKNFFDTFVSEFNREKDKKQFDRLLAVNGEPKSPFENRLLTLNGEERIVLWHNSVIRDESGGISALLSSGEDITNILRIEEERQQLQKRFQQARKMEAMGTLAGGIAHDFNNILYPIIGYAELAIDDLPEESKTRKDVQNILQGAIRAKELVRQILAFSRQKQLVKEPLLIQPIIKEALKLLRASIPKNIEIQQDISIDAEPVLGDPTQVYEIIMNLCTNAYHAMEEDGGMLTVEFNSVDIDRMDLMGWNIPAGKYCVLSVRDTGHGIPAEIMERIFDPYFTTKKIGKGSGLGLAVIHGIIQEYGGAIDVDSTPGKGTAFHIYFPVTCPAESKMIPRKKESVTQGTEKILFVDDEKDIVDLGVRMLEGHGYGVVGKTSSLEAYSLIESAPDRFDLLITDMTMPGMMGTALVKKIRKIRPDLPALICTGFSQYIDSDKADALEIQGFVRKPVSMGELLAKVREILDKKQGLDKKPGLDQ